CATDALGSGFDYW
nr:immunoglobulin heavy chain junction region [Macaca mulatta]